MDWAIRHVQKPMPMGVFLCYNVVTQVTTKHQYVVGLEEDREPHHLRQKKSLLINDLHDAGKHKEIILKNCDV